MRKIQPVILIIYFAVAAVVFTSCSGSNSYTMTDIIKNEETAKAQATEFVKKAFLLYLDQQHADKNVLKDYMTEEGFADAFDEMSQSAQLPEYVSGYILNINESVCEITSNGYIIIIYATETIGQTSYYDVASIEMDKNFKITKYLKYVMR